MAERQLEFYFDVGSPAAYLAWTQVPRIAEETGAVVDHRPFLLGGVFQATGNRSPTEVPAKGRYMMDDLQRFARRYAVPFQPNPHFPINTLMLMRGATGVQMHEPPRLRSYADAVFRAIWVEAKNMNDPATVGAVLQQAGFDAGQLLARAADPQVKERLKSVTQDAVARGVFGAPTFFVDGRMYWGQDRLDFVKEALQ
ncbi:MAG: 2-hydroxychromene-2-carboxylate isomerase-like protein [Ramlibacter sp.]|jgi:2-hydroxychromene-2-carboxylate isomerase|nr:2-hydroxychromene-2-carboxylate isomerase-like protein [Ramlibacter sp.]MDB5913859.1 2-hydroxychromene-2-carboxylate isomerase-like protein [Ramlibacter sp.]